jgi:hypothetical protein
LIPSPAQLDPLEAEWTAFKAASRARRLRSLRQFAEDEIIVPSGPLAGTRFRCRTQPALGVWFDLIQSGNWRNFCISGPVQDGKSFGGYVIPALYHLFEIGETAVLAAPDGDMVADKWKVDLLPVIQQTRYAELLPKSGKGSRGGDAGTIQFTNGQVLKFMTGGGGDEERSGFTTRVVFVTEADKLDEIGGTSREGKKIDQITARTAVYDDRARCYYECTVSIEEGFIWQQYQQGTATVLHCPCPHCGRFVPLEREDLHGWQEAESAGEAEDAAFYACRACGEAVTETERADMNRAAVPVHRGQAFNADNELVGDPPRTDTLGFRWSAGNSLFKSAATIGREEWKASRAVDAEAAETKMRQFTWTLPAVAAQLDVVPLKVETLLQRTRADWPRGVLRELPDALIVTSDLGKRLAHWVAIAWWHDGGGHVVDYGRLEIPSDDMPVERALLVALRNFKGEVIERGWLCTSTGQGPGDTMVQPQLSAFDARWQTNEKSVYAFCREAGPRQYVATMGQRDRKGSYVAPKNRTGNVIVIGPEFHITRVDSHKVFRFDVHSNWWKTYAHERLAVAQDKPGAVTFFWVPPRDRDNSHMAFVRHLLSEKKVEEFEPGKGLVTKWIAESRSNHWFDAFYNNCALAAYLGCSAIPPDERPQANPLAERKTIDLGEYYGGQSL